MPPDAAFSFDLQKLPFSKKGSLLLLQDAGPERGLFLSAASYYRYLGMMGNLCHFRPAEGDYTTHATPARVVVSGPRCHCGVTFADDQAFAFETEGPVRFDFDAKEQGILNVVELPGRRIDVTNHKGEHYVQFHLDDTVEAATQCDFRADGNQYYPQKITVTLRPRSGPRGRFRVSLATTELPYRAPGDFAAAERVCAEAWRAWLRPAPDVAETYADTYVTCLYSLYINILPPYGAVPRFGCTPSKGYFHGMFLYDGCFAALGLRYLDPGLARDQIGLMFDRQLPSGMVPDIVHNLGAKCIATKPPIESWTALRLLEAPGHLEFLRENYPRFVKWHDWWVRERDYDGDGIIQDNHYWDSGWDNSPVFDEGLPIEAADLNTHLILQRHALAEIAARLGRADEAEGWRRKAEASLAAFLRHSWNRREQRFHSPKSGGHGRVPTDAMMDLMPLLLGSRLPAAVQDALVRHLCDPAAYWGRWSLPTVAYHDSRYEPGNYWRGPIWVNVNYFMIEALERCGRADRAADLRDRTLELVSQHRYPYEHYDSGTGAGLGVAGFSWTAALFADLAIKQARGKLALD